MEYKYYCSLLPDWGHEKGKIAKIISLGSKFASGTPMEIDNLHVTMKAPFRFPVKDESQLIREIEKIAGKLRGAEAHFEQFGFFPESHMFYLAIPF